MRNGTTGAPTRGRAAAWAAGAAGVAAVTFLAFSPALRNEFVNWDDRFNFVSNPNYRGLGVDNLRWMFTTFLTGPYQPLSWISLAVDYRLWGPGPVGHHFGNLVYHALTAAGVFLIARRLLRREANPPGAGAGVDAAAACAALLFAVHPLRVESVAWATERRDVLSGLLLTVTVLLYLRAQDDSRRRWLLLAASVAVYGLSLLAKASGMTLPAVLLALDAYPLRRLGLRGTSKRAILRVLLEKAPFAALALVAAGVALYGQVLQPGWTTLSAVPFSVRIRIASYATCFYLGKTFAPLRLSPIYALPSWELLNGPVYWGAVVLVAATTLSLAQLSRRWPAGITTWACYLFLLAPTSGLVQAGPQVAADRYTYLPGMALAILAGAGFLWAGRAVGSRAVFAACAAVVAMLAWRTAAQTGLWHDSESLWRHAIAYDPRSALAHAGLGFEFLERKDFPAAMEEYATACRLDPTNPEHQTALSALQLRFGNDEAAIVAARRAIAQRPDYGRAHFLLGAALLARGQVPAAAAALRQAVALSPGDPKAHTRLGQALLLLGDEEEGERHVYDGIRLDPSDVRAYRMGAKILAQRGRNGAAEALLRAGLRVKPGDAEMSSMLTEMLEKSRRAATTTTRASR